jgi:GNAT superfamily N-acetyltransferase
VRSSISSLIELQRARLAGVAVLIDEALWWHRGRRWCHLVSDESYDELHDFVAALGIPRRAFQGDHYDIPEEYRPAMVAAGATEVSSRELLRRLRAAGLRLTPSERRGHDTNPVLYVAVRDAETADLPALRDLFRRSSLSNDSDRSNLLANPEVLEWTPPTAGRGQTRVAVVDGSIAGFATTTVGDGCLELEDLFVDPGMTRLGIGRALVQDAMGMARARPPQRIEVSANDHALGFYQRLGFVAHDLVETRFGTARRLHLDLLVPG